MKKKALAIVMAALVGMTLLAGCGGNSAKSSGTNEIVVALIANTTGDYAQYGIPVRNAAMMYFDKVNANGGINGKKITVLEYDDKADGVESKNAFNLAMEKHISAVLGSVLTGATIALADAAYEAGVPQVTASATAEGVTVIDPDDPASGIRDNVFRSCFIDPFQGEKMADYAVNKLGAKTAAIFYEIGSDYSEGVKAAFESTAARLGLQIVAAEAFAAGEVDFKPAMTNIAVKNPDVVFAPIYYGEAGLAITAARAAGCKAIFLGADGFSSVKDYASAADLEGTLYCSGYAPGSDSVKQFEQDYCKTWNVDAVPNMFAPLAYDAAMIICDGLEKAEAAGLTPGTKEYRDAVRDAIASMRGVAGITGAYSFDAKNNPIKEAAIIELTGGDEAFKEMY